MPIYDVIGQSYSKSRLPDSRIVDSLLYLLALDKGSIVADLGAGTGGYSWAIANQGFVVYAVEPSQVMRSQAIPHPQVQWINGFAEAIPLQNHSVDAAFLHFSHTSFFCSRKRPPRNKPRDKEEWGDRFSYF